MIAPAALAVLALVAGGAALLAMYTAFTVDRLPEDAASHARVIWYHGRVLTLLGLATVDLSILALVLWGVGSLALLASRAFGAR